MRLQGCISRGIRLPIIREGDNLREIVTNSVLEASKEGKYLRRKLNSLQNFLPSKI